MNSTPTKIVPVGYLVFCSLFVSISVSAQITRDGTTSTEVTSDNNNFTIDGGEQAGGNLFHSFNEFSVPTSGSAYFNNTPDVENIINRVTGGSISTIDGLLKANYGANLFLINPAGIIFGQNARLDLGGSFYGSTADSVSFPDGVELDANNLQPPVLTINAPIGLNFRDNPGDIIVQGNGNGARLDEDLVNNQDGLQVNFDQTLALIGGNLTLEDATLITSGGTIELASVGGNEQVNFTPTGNNFSLDYQDVDNFRDIQLSQRTTVNTSSVMGGGKVRLQGKNITLNEQSAILSDTFGDAEGKGIDIQASETLQLAGKAFISTSTSGSGIAGPLNIQARQEIRLTGDGISNLDIFLKPELLREQLFAPEAEPRELRENGGLFAVSFGGEQGGDITIETGKLLLQNGFIVINSTFNNGGIGGNVEIQTSDSVKIINSALFNTTVNDSQEAGNIDINTNKLRLEGIGGVFTSTLFNSGAAGDIYINANDSVELDGSISDDSTLPKGILSNSVDSDGDAGNILIETSKLLVDQAQITSTSSGAGRGGDIEIKASNSVQLIGSGLDNLENNELLLLSRDLNSSNIQQVFGIVAGTDGSGNSGQIAVNSPSVSLREGAVVSSIAFPNSTGAAGDISIFNADNLRVKDSRISSSTLGNGNGGNIKLNTLESVQIINSQISSSSLFGEGNAGDINITTGRLILDSGLVITASGAITPEMIITRGGTGGNIDINAKESIELIGNQPNDTALVASTFTDSSAGDVTIITNKLIVRDGADITVSSGISENAALGGDAGTLKITANSLNLDNQAQISATTNSGDGGNIILELDDNLV
ncbi:MAG: filamentous hemagglutinin N-terminal domain-containing protein, partial [Xenococcaceae cyanobacterium]